MRPKAAGRETMSAFQMGTVITMRGRELGRSRLTHSGRRVATMSWPELISSRSALPVKPGQPMQQIGDWLEKLGMSEYAQRFAENRIDFSVLPDLTDQHLKDLGLPLGDRLKCFVRSESFPVPIPRCRSLNRSLKTAPSAVR